MDSPARFRTFWVAGIGPSPIQLGSTPATAVAITRASGVDVPCPPPSFPVSSNAAAPSLIPLELAAVTVPSCLNAGFSFATASSVVPRRGYSSFEKVVPSGSGTDTSSSVKTQSLSARSARGWLSGAERGHARHVAIVLARLVGAPEDHVVDRARVDAGALHHGFDRNRGEIVRS